MAGSKRVVRGGDGEAFTGGSLLVFLLVLLIIFIIQKAGKH